MHGCARGPPPVGRWGGRSNPPLVTQSAYLIFNVCISTLETEFLQVSHQKQTYLGVVERFITGHEDCTDIHSICDSCGATQLKVIMKMNE